MADPLERHFLFALPWLAAFVAAAAAHVSVIRELPTPTTADASARPLVDVDIAVEISTPAPPPAPPPPDATVITMDAACTDADRPALAPELLFGVRQLGPAHFRVERHVVDGILSADLERVRMIPAVRDGQPHGVKLFGVRSCSPLGLLGLQNGDLVLRIDGEPIGAPASTVMPYRRLQTAERVTVDLLRRGQPISLVYEIH